MRPTDLVVGLLGPMLGALAAALGVSLKDRLQRRDEEYRRKEALSRASQEVAFIQAWIAAHQTVASEQQRRSGQMQALVDLERVYKVLTSPVLLRAVQPREPQTAGVLVRSLLLIGKMTTVASIVRVLYYVVLLVVFTLISLFTSILVEEPSWGLGVVYFVFTCVMMLIAWGVRSLTLWVHRS